VVGGEAEELKNRKVLASDEVTSGKEGEVKKEALSDVWIFDTFYRQWKELKDLQFKIQAPASGKKIRKFFEPRMAHTACVIDQYVVIFGGLNSSSTSLVSNDLYVLSLDGNTNAILSDN